jgi:hypothetical protein
MYLCFLYVLCAQCSPEYGRGITDDDSNSNSIQFLFISVLNKQPDGP